MKYIVLLILLVKGVFSSDINPDMQIVREKVKFFYSYIEKRDTFHETAPFSSLVKELGYPEVYIHLGRGEPLDTKNMMYFTEKLNTLLAKEMQQNFSYCLDYNFLTHGQDDWLTDFKIDYKQITPEQINVILSFKNFYEKLTTTFYFTKQSNIWLIEDINNGSSLLKTLESCKSF